MATLSPTRRTNLIAAYTLATAVLVATAAHLATHSHPGYHHLFGPFGLQLSYDYGNVLNHHPPTPLSLGVNIAIWTTMWLALSLTLRTHVSSVALGLVAGGALTSATFEVVNHRVPNYITVGTLFTCNLADLSISIGIVLLTLSVNAAALRRYRAHTNSRVAPDLPN
jgi:lipoprotein signal peptidase